MTIWATRPSAGHEYVRRAFAIRRRSARSFISTSSFSIKSTIKVNDVPEASTCLIIQPMSVERVTAYLRISLQNREPKIGLAFVGPVIGRALGSRRKFRGCSREMLDQAERGVLSRTRAEILRRMVDGRIAQITGPVGMRARVEDVLTRLAWEMYSERITNLPGTDLFNLLMNLRGNRDYSLVDFRTQLINPCRIMAAGDEDGLRFAYPGFRSYCCALYTCTGNAGDPRLSF